MVFIDNVSISYKTKKEILPVINNLSLKINQGEALAILGPSGCGKSTLINALAGIISLDSGSIEYIRDNMKTPLSSKTHKIGLIPQNFGLLPWKTVKENCFLPLKIRNIKITKELKLEILQIYDALNITYLLDSYPRELSGGQAQRTAIARAFILMPDLLLMDEPFSALDEITRDGARELFLKIWSLNQPTTILVTHSIEEALYLGNRIIVMGNHMGEIKHELINTNFGVLNPDNVEYLITKKLLREKLKTRRSDDSE